MKRYLIAAIFAIVIIFSLIAFLNISVTTRQGINYQWSTIKIPLYLKVLNFFDRHYNYTELVKRITYGCDTEKDKAIKILQWTYKNLKKIPEGLPVIDDHIWYVIVRGYGTRDQFQDVFSTLCNYARLPTFYLYLYSFDKTNRIPVSFVRISGRWFIFDAYNGVYFINKEGELVDAEAIRRDSAYTAVNTENVMVTVDYDNFLKHLSEVKNRVLKRPAIQSPLRRIMFEFKQWRERKR